MTVVESFSEVSKWRRVLEFGSGKTGNVTLCAQPVKNLPDPKGDTMYYYKFRHHHSRPNI